MESTSWYRRQMSSVARTIFPRQMSWIAVLALSVLWACANNGSSSAPEPAKGVQNRGTDGNSFILRPVADACTELECDESDPCCNSCELKGWYPVDEGPEVATVELAEGAPPLPTDVALDSCEVGSYHLRAVGHRQGNTWTVDRWTKVAGPVPK